MTFWKPAAGHTLQSIINQIPTRHFLLAIITISLSVTDRLPFWANIGVVAIMTCINYSNFSSRGKRKMGRELLKLIALWPGPLTK